MDPLLRLSPALYTALAGLTAAGVAVPVVEVLSGPLATHYVLLQQPTAVTLSNRATCRRWECTALVDVVTQFQREVSHTVAADLCDQILTRLDGVRLALPAGWQCSPGRCELNTDGPADETDGELRVVRRLLRLRWALTYSPPS